MPDFPTQPGSQVFIAPQQMQGFIDSINSLNAAINRIAGAPGTGGGAFRAVRDEAESQGEGEIGALEANQRAAAAQAIGYKKGHAAQAKQRLEEVIKANQDKQIALLKAYGEYTEKQAREIRAGLKGGKSLPEEMNDAVLRKFNSVLDQQGTSKFSQILTAVEESGIRQLRFGELPTQDILRAAGTLASRYYGYRYQKAAAAQGITPEELASGARAPVVGRGLSMLGSLGPALATAGKFVGAADVVGELAKHYYEEGIGQYRALTASGQLTGQGTMAGFEAKYISPLKIFNPFGMIGFGTAQEIVQNAREQGFTGPVAGQLEQGMANVISHTGIQVGQATEFFTQSMREGGMSVGQVTQEMNRFHDATRNLNMNINDYTQQIMTSTETLRDMGAGTVAPVLAQQITAALPRAYRTPEGMQFLTGAFEKSRGVLASMVGHGANVLNIGSQRYASAAWSALDTVLGRSIAMAKNQGYKTPNDIANYLSQVDPFFQGTNVNMLQEYISRVEHGRGIGAQITLSHAHNIFNQRLAAASRKTVRYSQLTGGDLKNMRLVPVYRNMWTHHLTSQAGPGNILAGYRDENGMGQFHALNAFTTTTGDYYTGRSAVVRGELMHFGQLHSGPGNLGTFNIAKEEQAKRAFLEEAKRSHFLNSRQIAELQKVKPQNISSALNTIMQQQIGPKVNVGTQVGTITIELGKQAQGLLTLVKERQNSVANGTVQNNQTGR